MYTRTEDGRRHGRCHALPLAGLALLALMASALPATAQDMSPQQLRDACVSDPSNTVHLTSAAKVFGSASIGRLRSAAVSSGRR